jgi:hypothetical protein
MSKEACQCDKAHLYNLTRAVRGAGMALCLVGLTKRHGLAAAARVRIQGPWSTAGPLLQGTDAG